MRVLWGLGIKKWATFSKRKKQAAQQLKLLSEIFKMANASRENEKDKTKNTKKYSTYFSLVMKLEPVYHQLLTYILHVSTLSVNVYRKAARIFLPVFTD
jgi:hypothetical protein